MNPTATFAQRIEIGRECEARFRAYCESIGLTVIETTQHLADQVKEHARHFPDFYIIEKSMFIQVKDARHSEKWPDVIVEKSLLTPVPTCQNIRRTSRLFGSFPAAIG